MLNDHTAKTTFKPAKKHINKLISINIQVGYAEQ